MADQRVSMFVSHKVASHKRAAVRIRDILQSRTERLDVQICETIDAGVDWRKWIRDHIAQAHMMLVILPRTPAELQWIGVEIGSFQAEVPGGRLVALKRPSDPVPDIVANLQVIDSVKEVIKEKFLEPLYRHTTFTGLDAPLNGRVSDLDISRDAQEIAEALAGVLPTRSESFGESLVVETSELDVTRDLDEAQVIAFEGFSAILNWQRQVFTWSELRQRAAEAKGKGTFWVTEMQQVMTEAVRQDCPKRIMSSTFRGRGNTAGRIFRPVLDRVDYIENKPVRFHFVFHEVLVPELVRARGTLGDVFNLLYIATRVRWEVLYPFLIKPWLANDGLPAKWEMSKEEQDELVGSVIRSMRLIEFQIERHDMLESVFAAFDGTDRRVIAQMLQERQSITDAIEAAAQQNDLARLMEDLKHALDLNCRVMELLAGRFQQLVTEDTGRLREMLRETASEPPGVMRAKSSA